MMTRAIIRGIRSLAGCWFYLFCYVLRTGITSTTFGFVCSVALEAFVGKIYGYWTKIKTVIRF